MFSLSHASTGWRRVANRAKRQVISQVPPARWAADSIHARRVRSWSAQRPQVRAEDAHLLQTLNTEAIRVCSLPELDVPGTPALMEALDRLVVSLQRQDPRGASTVRPAQAELVEDLALWHWGLQPALLDLVENYLGQPARYYGPDVRREVADRKASGVRQWHRDIEDRRMIKILVWLNDVDEQGGPFAHISVGRSNEATRSLRYVAGFVSDERLRTVVPPDEVRTVPGPKWTTLVADNTRIIHRATPPVARDRYSVTFTYSSRHPLRTMDSVPWDAEQALRIRSGLSSRQLACLPSRLTHP